MPEIITAVGVAIGAILAGIAAVIASLNRRDSKEVRDNVRTGNGRTLGETVARIEGALTEHLRQHERFG